MSVTLLTDKLADFSNCWPQTAVYRYSVRILHYLQHNEDKTIVMIDKNDRQERPTRTTEKGLAFADVDNVRVSGEVVISESVDELTANPKAGDLFPGG